MPSLLISPRIIFFLPIGLAHYSSGKLEFLSLRVKDSRLKAKILKFDCEIVAVYHPKLYQLKIQFLLCLKTSIGKLK